jgi:DNA replication protein DnaC
VTTSGPKNIYKKSEENNKKEKQRTGQNLIKCSDCDDLLWVKPRYEENGFNSGKLILCDCVKEEVINKQKQILREVEDIGDITPVMMKKMTFKSFKTDVANSNLGEAKETAEKYSNNLEGWLVLTGPTGVGKTHLAIAIATQRLKSYQSLYFGFLPNILERLRNFNQPSSNGQNPSAFLSFLIDCPFLIIDDLGSQASSHWAEEKIYQIIVGRHNAELPTVITTRASNIDDGLVFNPQISEAIKSRLQDMTVVNELPIVAPDYRAR